MTDTRELSVDDLVDLTTAIHKLKPSTEDKIVIGVEPRLEGDMNIVFLMVEHANPENEPTSVILSTEYIHEQIADGKLQE